MAKLIPGILAIAVFGTACGSGNGPDLSAAAPPAESAAPASQLRPASDQAATATSRNQAGSGASARPASSRSAMTSRNGSARDEAASAARTGRPDAGPVYREMTLPTGTVLPLELTSAVASDASEVEDTVRATLRRTITLDGEEVLPAGTELAGHVTEAEQSGRVKGRARVAFRFTTLRHDGERMSLRTDPIVHEAEATKGEDATKIGVGAGAGAVIGAVVGGKSGAAKGAAIGGAAGTGVVMATRGKEVRLEPGTDISARLAAPLTIRVAAR
jgi:hypothetical protein